MGQNIGLIVLVFGFVFAVLAARGVGAPVWTLGWLALACQILYFILGGAAKVFG